VYFGGLPAQTTTDHIDCGGLQWQTTKSSQVAAPNN
jgi:hypothetical protein